MKEIAHIIVGNYYPRETRKLFKLNGRARRIWEQKRDQNYKNVLNDKTHEVKREIPKLE